MGERRGRWGWVALGALAAAPALGAPAHLSPAASPPARLERWLVRGPIRPAVPPQHAAEYFRGLPWSPPRFSLFDAYRADAFSGLGLTLGTVGAMTTSFDDYRELAGVRQTSQVSFPGVRLALPGAGGVPLQLGAGLLVALDRSFRPDRIWGVFALSGRL